MEARDNGIDADVLDSTKFTCLKDKYWVVYSGAYKDVLDAHQQEAKAKRMKYPYVCTSLIDE